MTDLTQSLGGHDLGYLQIVAELWGLEFSVADFHQGLEIIVPLLCDPQLATDIVKSLPKEAQEALDELLGADVDQVENSWRAYLKLKVSGDVEVDLEAIDDLGCG